MKVVSMQWPQCLSCHGRGADRLPVPGAIMYKYTNNNLNLKSTRHWLLLLASFLTSAMKFDLAV